MFNFGKPKTSGDWIVHIAGAIVAIFLVWWMLRMYVLCMRAKPSGVINECWAIIDPQLN
jgi:hypothetical protein